MIATPQSLPPSSTPTTLTATGTGRVCRWWVVTKAFAIFSEIGTSSSLGRSPGGGRDRLRSSVGGLPASRGAAQPIDLGAGVPQLQKDRGERSHRGQVLGE